jgi:hypothetical protein
MRRVLIGLIAVVLAAGAALMAPATASATPPNAGCPSDSSGWQLETFQQYFNNDIQDALNAGMTVNQILAIYNQPTLEALYTNLALPGYQAVDKNGDGMLCQKNPPALDNLGIPYLSNIRDNNTAANH